jgi:predicted NBD/HSP70 family sugar kinase
MTLFDLLLILVVLATVVSLLTLAGALLFRRWRIAQRLAIGLLSVWVVYLAAGTAIAVLSPQRILALGEDRCFDEMCFAVTGFQRTPAIESPGGTTRARGVFYILDARVSSRSHGRAQREIGRQGLLVDQTGNSYEVSQEGMQALAGVEGPLPGLDTEVAPGQAVSTKLVFDVPADIGSPAFTLGTTIRFFPPLIILGDDEHFLHKPTIVRLE